MNDMKSADQSKSCGNKRRLIIPTSEFIYAKFALEVTCNVAPGADRNTSKVVLNGTTSGGPTGQRLISHAEGF